MATFRFSSFAVIMIASLACARASEEPVEKDPGPQPALIAQHTIEHIAPERDSVGPMPARFEWTAIEGAESYTFALYNEVGLVATSANISRTTLDWPEADRLSSGTYYWIVTAMRDRHSIASSGRSAFVVME